MSPRGRGGALGALAPLLLIVAGLFLIVRVWGAVGVVLRPLPTASAGAGSGAASLVAQAREKDRGLAAVDPGGRDPLHRPPAASPPPTGRQAAPVEEPPPDLRMLLYDQVSPVVQIAVAGELSPRLRVGETYRGWRVESITSSAVLVSKDGRTHSLSSRRAQ